MEAHGRSTLVLDWNDLKVTHTGNASSLALGSQPGADLRLVREFTSRHHACIERRNHDFVLVDHSTNGTYVQTEDERITYVHRAVLRLWGDGWISLGEPLCDEAAIRFQLR